MMDSNPSIPTRPRPRPAGFTLTELLIVIGVIVLLFTIALPAFRTMMTTGNADSAFTAVSAATATIRAYSTRPESFVNGDYQGTALLFTPANEIRFVQHDEFTLDGSNKLLMTSYTPPKYGYVDIPGQGYIPLPDDAGVVGIALGGTSATMYFFAPPFAVRFNSQGELIARRSTTTATGYDGNVYYDGNGDGQCVTSKDRGSPYASGATSPASGYDPAEWDPSSTRYTGYNDTTTKAGVYTLAGKAYNGKYKLPFECIDTVVGVVLYSKQALLSSGNNLIASGTGSPINSAAQTWLLQNGQIYFFNKYTGGLVKQ